MEKIHVSWEEIKIFLEGVKVLLELKKLEHERRARELK